MQRNKRLTVDHKNKFAAPQTRKPIRWFIAGLAALLLIGVLIYSPTEDTAPAVDVAQPAPTATAAPSSAQPGDKIDFTVQRNDTLEKIFRRLKLSLNDLAAILHLPGVGRNLNQIKPGATVSVVHEDGTVHALNHRISETEILSVTRGNEGFSATVIATPIEVRTARANGTIDTSLFVAARAAGVSPETIMQLANEIFGWEIDFALDIRPGDRFSLIYGQKYRDGKYIGDAHILAAEFVNGGEIHRAVHYASADGKIDSYFTPDGHSMRRQFLRAPLDFTRVSSNFSLARRHPILNTMRAHQGVDYSAPTGTIIKAAGDGRVAFVGEKGGYGRAIILEHGGGISTLYGHLSRFGQGTHNGKRVKQGETIGYVGSSGAATGPHLHYEYRVNGIHMNPRTVHLPDAAPIPVEYMADFQSKAQPLLANLERAPQTVATAQANN